MSFEIIRLSILIVGWALLVLEGIPMLRGAAIFYRRMAGRPLGRIIFLKTASEFTVILGVAVIATALLRADTLGESFGVIALCIAWFFLMIVSAHMTSRARKEIATLVDVYEHTDELIKIRTKELYGKQDNLGKVVEELEKSKKESEDAKQSVLHLLEDARMAEGQLKKERDQSQAIFASMNEGVFVVDEEYRVVLMNPRAGALLHFSASDAIGKKLPDIITVLKHGKELPRDERPIAETLRTGVAIRLGIDDAVSVRTAQGIEFPVTLSTAPLRGGSAKGAIVVFHDSTEEKRLDQAKVNFISVASHQLRTPLTAVRWYAEMLIAGDAGVLTDNQRQYVDQVYKGTLRLIEMVNILLSLARVEGGRIKVEPVKIEIVSFIKTIISELAIEIQRNNIHVRVIEPLVPPPHISLDPALFRQVILNLLSNSILYMEHGGNIEVVIESGDIAARVAVRDDGIGIPLEKQNRVFEKFFRGDNARVKVPEGTGLGLNLVRELVNLWSGTISFESPTIWRVSGGNTEHKGTCFYFTIPYQGMSPRLEGKPLA